MAFFSGTDTSTLQSEGNDTNCFVSLIVNNEGTYCAAITRKLSTKVKTTTEYLSRSYEFFGEGAVGINDTPPNSISTNDNTAIEYFMLDVQREVVDNPFDYLDKRFEEIEAKKKAEHSQSLYYQPTVNTGMAITPYSKEEQDYSFHDYLHKDRQPAVIQPSLFPDDKAEQLIDTLEWKTDPVIIHDLVCKMIACSLIIDTKKFDLKQWITRFMVKKYKEIFGTDYDVPSLFSTWAEAMVEFLLNCYDDPELPVQVYEDYDLYQSKIAKALLDELCLYPTNDFIEEYKNILSRYIYE